MSDPIRLGIAGLGTVGVGVVKIVQRQAALLAARCGRPIEIVAVSARSKDKDRGVNLTRYAWEDDPVALARRPDIDVFVELMGGSEGPAKDATEAAIAALACRHRTAPPNTNLDDVGDIDETGGLSLVREAAALDGGCAVVTNSLGFGGTNTSLAFRAILVSS